MLPQGQLAPRRVLVFLHGDHAVGRLPPAHLAGDGLAAAVGPTLI